MPGSETQVSGRDPDCPASHRKVAMGRIAGVHGLQGWLKLISYTDPREGIFDYRPLWVGGQVFEEFEGKAHGKGLLIRFAGRNDRNSSEGLVGSLVEVERSRLPDPPEGEYYWSDLEGLAVVNRDGKQLGRVHRVLPTGADAVLEVQGEKTLLIPWVNDTYVFGIDLKAGLVEVDWDPDWI